MWFEQDVANGFCYGPIYALGIYKVQPALQVVHKKFTKSRIAGNFILIDRFNNSRFPINTYANLYKETSQS